MIKKFNEVDKVELKETCELYLAYLIDRNFRVNTSSGDLGRVIVEVNKSELFEWGDIKNMFIPFIKVISREYKLESLVIFSQCRVRSIELDDIINNNVINNLPMKAVIFFVKGVEKRS